jgi:hypothetical protein
MIGYGRLPRYDALGILAHRALSGDGLPDQTSESASCNKGKCYQLGILYVRCILSGFPLSSRVCQVWPYRPKLNLITTVLTYIKPILFQLRRNLSPRPQYSKDKIFRPKVINRSRGLGSKQPKPPRTIAHSGPIAGVAHLAPSYVAHAWPCTTVPRYPP